MRKFLRNVSCASELAVVPADQDSVFRRNKIGFDIVGALFNRQPVGLQRVFRPVTGRSTVGDDKRFSSLRPVRILRFRSIPLWLDALVFHQLER